MKMTTEKFSQDDIITKLVQGRFHLRLRESEGEKETDR